MAAHEFDLTSPRDARGPGSRPSAAAAFTATLGLAAAGWVLAAAQMRGMDMGDATALGPLRSFIGLWIAMIAAMMLPGAAAAVLRRVRDSGMRAAAAFLAAYLGVWTSVGFAVHALYRPHGAVLAGVVVTIAGLYELTPLKRRLRRRCRSDTGGGIAYGIACLGSSLGLMLIGVVIAVMNPAWMAVTTVLVTGQKLLSARAALDVPLAVAVLGLGVLILIAPASVPGLAPAM